MLKKKKKRKSLQTLVEGMLSKGKFVCVRYSGEIN